MNFTMLNKRGAGLFALSMGVGLASPALYAQGTHSIDAFETEVVRLNDGQPIISAENFKDVTSDDGHSINGPSMIRIPDWIAEEDRLDPSAKYYLYFGDHSGSYIRLAWAADITGPYTLYNADNDGVLGLSAVNTVFKNASNTINSDHISSPDVMVEDGRIIMFFHIKKKSNFSATDSTDSWFDTGSQQTVCAVSTDGLNFTTQPKLIGNAYFRSFKHNNNWYAFTNYGPIWKGPSTDSDPWDVLWDHVAWAGNNATTSSSGNGELTGGGNPIWDNLMANYAANGLTDERGYAGFNGNKGFANQNAPRTGAPRHFATRLLNDGTTLEVYYTCRGEMPESIYKTTMDMSSGDYDSWTTDVTGDAWVHERILYPEYSWEGSDLTPAYSLNGAETDVNALRDPYVFTDTDGKSYLLYSGNPESAIGIASINNKPVAIASASVQTAEVGESISFSANASYDTDGSLTNYNWDLDDGRTASGKNRSRSFSAPGTYNVELVVTDNLGSTSAVDIVQVVVTAASNSAPVITEGDSVTVNMSQDSNPTAFSLKLHATDADGDAISWSIVSSASNGNSSLVSGTGTTKTVRYTPNTGFYGSDSFEVKASDSNGGEDTVTVNVNVERAPIEVPPNYEIDLSKSENGNMTISWPTEAGVLYSIYQSSDLENWDLYRGDIAPVPPSNELVIPVGDYDKLFIRVEMKYDDE